jgi:hypothetical protein
MSGDSYWQDRYESAPSVSNAKGGGGGWVPVPSNTDADQAQSEHWSKTDWVESPSHYTNGKIEAIEYFEDNMPLDAIIGALEYQVKKYMHRWRYKGKPLEDLKKAQWNLNRLITKMEGK